MIPSDTLDHLIDSKIIGRRTKGRIGPQYLPRYSRDWTDAWDVVDSVRARGYTFTLAYDQREGTWGTVFEGHGRRAEARGITAAHSISLAALKLVSADTSASRA